MCGEFATQSVRWDEVDEGSLAVDLDDREPFPVAGLEFRIAGDVDLLEGDAARLEDSPCALAEVAALRVVEDNKRLGSDPFGVGPLQVGHYG